MIVTRIQVLGDSGNPYEITPLEGGAVMYCTCPAWKFSKASVYQRTCKHIEYVKSAIKTPASV